MFEKFGKTKQTDHEPLMPFDPAGRPGRTIDMAPIRDSEVAVAEAYDVKTAPIEEKSAPAGELSPAAAASSPDRTSERSESQPNGHGTGAAAAAPARDLNTPLFSPEQVKDFRTRWDSIQIIFVDEPRVSVERADALVTETMKSLTEIFAGERQRLAQEWGREVDVSTEELRQAIRLYRAFFGRFLSL